MKIVIAGLVLLFVSLACGQYITPTAAPVVSTPTVTASPLSPTQTASAPTATQVSTAQTATIARPIVQVHKSAASAEVIGYLSEGDSVTVKSCIDKWCEIEPNGFVYQGCLDGANPDGLKCEAR